MFSVFLLRTDFLDAYLSRLSHVFEEGVDLRGYFAWTFMDNFEWEKGYHERFGLVYVDFATQKRIPKDSAYWYQQVMETNGACLSGIKTDRENHEIRGFVRRCKIALVKKKEP